MSNLGKPVTLKDRIVRNRVRRVGIELEGAWTRPLPVWEGHKHHVERDGSLDDWCAKLYRKGLVMEPTSRSQVGEVTSLPITPDKVDDWMDAMWPDMVDPTEKCSMHTHLSFNDVRTYARIADPRYPATVIEYLKRWATEEKVPEGHPLWDRLNGKCIYCQHTFDFTGQLKNTRKDYEKDRKGHRYTAINFAFNRFGTVECRLLTMFPDKEQSKRAVKEVIRITNAFLASTASRPKKAQGGVKAGGAPPVKEIRIYV